MHFGPRHWLGKSELLLEKLNSYAADIVINTGDNTTDALENEFEAANTSFRFPEIMTNEICVALTIFVSISKT